MFITQKTCLASVSLEPKEAMRAQILRLSLHFLAGLVMAIFLLPEGIAIVLIGTAAAAGAKAFYDYLDHGVDVPACLCLVLGAIVVLMAAALPV